MRQSVHRICQAFNGPPCHHPQARIDGSENPEIYWFHNQPNGTPERLTDAEGQLRWEGQNSAWGKLLRESSLQGPGFAQNLRMQGQYLDRETGLHYNLFRYYDPDCGRFTQPDPIGLLGGLNLYQYAPNALVWVDPLGLSRCSVNQARQRQHAMLKNSNDGYNISPKDWDDYPAIGRDGTFISDKQGVMQYFPHAGNTKEITITRAKARVIERDMGLNKDSLSGGFKVRRITGLRDLEPRSPLGGNDFFKGPGQHLPGGAPEMVINSQSTQDNSVIKTILIVNVGRS